MVTIFSLPDTETQRVYSVNVDNEVGWLPSVLDFVKEVKLISATL